MTRLDFNESLEVQVSVICHTYIVYTCAVRTLEDRLALIIQMMYPHMFLKCCCPTRSQAQRHESLIVGVMRMDTYTWSYSKLAPKSSLISLVPIQFSCLWPKNMLWTWLLQQHLVQHSHYNSNNVNNEVFPTLHRCRRLQISTPNIMTDNTSYDGF